MVHISQQTKQQIQNKLLHWFRQNAREMPWRQTKDPYKIWVSEIMLQQTQVDTVIPYYKRWIKKFPNIKSLATASQSDALKLWAGLGYYRRARMLHAGAQFLFENKMRTLPSNVEELQKLPGIGRYTAGAITSIAFNKPAPILDGNVIRIFTRIFAIKEDITELETQKKLWGISETLVPKNHPGDFNQSMMELGATVCFPDNPQCSKCPVKILCKAHALKKETAFPVKLKKEKLIAKKNTALVFKNKKGVFIQKQPKEDRWGGLWMFPFWEKQKTMLEETHLEKSKLRKLLTLSHGFTKYRIELNVFETKTTPIISKKNITKKQHKWVSVKELKKYAFPSPHQKIVKHLVKEND